MPKHSYYLFILIILSSAFLSGCATRPSNDPSLTIQQTAKERTAQLTQINQYHLRGKIAFIEQLKNQQSKRESATIIWRTNEINQIQELNLTSYLGINVLHLESEKNQHLIKVNGKEYRTNNLDQLVHSLTGLTLPTKALSFWLKGLPFQSTDKVSISPKTQLPVSLISFFDDIQWQVHYDNYQVFDGIQMATKFTIKKNGLLIKVAIKKWSLTN